MVKPGEYKIIINLIDDMILSTRNAAQNIEDIFSTLSNTDTLKRAQTFTGVTSSTLNAYNSIISDSIEYPSALKAFVIKLNNHILEKYNAKTIDDFLLESFLESGEFFAEISNKLGFNVTVIGDMSARWTDIDVPIDELGAGENPNPNLYWDFIGGTNYCK